jgi:hypothetical protein
VDNAPRYVISEVVDSRWYRGAKAKFPNPFVQDLVSWEGYGPEENSWEPFEMLEGMAIEALIGLHKGYPAKRRDHHVKL